MKEKILKALNHRLNESLPLRSLNGGYRWGMEDAIKITESCEEIVEEHKDYFPPLTDNPLSQLFTSHGMRIYGSVGILCQVSDKGIEFGKTIYQRVIN